MSDDVELQVEIVRARNDWARERRQHEVRVCLAEIRGQRAALRRCDQSLLAEERRLEQELGPIPGEHGVVHHGPVPQAVTQTPSRRPQDRNPPLPEHLRPKVANSE